jgi:hypothetical protein
MPSGHSPSAPPGAKLINSMGLDNARIRRMGTRPRVAALVRVGRAQREARGAGHTARSRPKGRTPRGHNYRNQIHAKWPFPKASLSGDFKSLFSIHPDFENSTEEFHPHETISTPIKLLSSLFINMVSYQHN